MTDKIKTTNLQSTDLFQELSSTDAEIVKGGSVLSFIGDIGRTALGVVTNGLTEQVGLFGSQPPTFTI